MLGDLLLCGLFGTLCWRGTIDPPPRPKGRDTSCPATGDLMLNQLRDISVMRMVGVLNYQDVMLNQRQTVRSVCVRGVGQHEDIVLR